MANVFNNSTKNLGQVISLSYSGNTSCWTISRLVMAKQMGLEDQEGIHGEDDAPPAYEAVVEEVSDAAKVVGMLLPASTIHYNKV